MKVKSLTVSRSIFVLLLIIITILTVTPNPENTGSGLAIARWISEVLFGSSLFGDKVAHFGAYAVLGASAFFARFDMPKAWLTAPLLLAIYGALLEVVQGLGGVRSPELSDAAANSLGAVAGFAAAFGLVNLRRGKAA